MRNGGDGCGVLITFDQLDALCNDSTLDRSKFPLDLSIFLIKFLNLPFNETTLPLCCVYRVASIDQLEELLICVIRGPGEFVSWDPVASIDQLEELLILVM